MNDNWSKIEPPVMFVCQKLEKKLENLTFLSFEVVEFLLRMGRLFPKLEFQNSSFFPYGAHLTQGFQVRSYRQLFKFSHFFQTSRIRSTITTTTAATAILNYTYICTYIHI
jgi:hypothetical protein